MRTYMVQPYDREKILHYGMLIVLVVMTAAIAITIGVCSHKNLTPRGERLSLAGPWKINTADDPKFALPEYNDASWDTVDLPGSVIRNGEGQTGGITGIVWVRRSFDIGRDGDRRDLGLMLGQIANADEAYFNGVKIGATGTFPPAGFSMWYHPRYYAVPASLIRRGEKNVIAVRIWYYMFGQVQGDMALAGMEEWRIGKTVGSFFLVTLNYILIAAGIPLFFIFFFFFIRRPLSQEYFFYCLQLLCGLFVILELCSLWDIYGTILNRFKILGVSWAALNVAHPIFLHRIYDLKRKKFEILLWVYLAVVVFVVIAFTSAQWLRVHGLLMIIVTIGIGVYNFSCHVSALYKRSPYAKLFSFFGSVVVITAIHDGCIYLFKFMGLDLHCGPLFQYMLFPIGAAVLYTGTTLVLVSRFIGMMDEIEDLNTSLENFVIENALLNDRILETKSARKQPALNITSRIEEKMQIVKKYIEENYASDISREGLAASVDVHPDNLGKLFKTYSRQKLGDYIYELRVRDAAKMLLETDDTVINIAFSVGFESLRTFNRIFPKFMGMTPEKYRRHHKK